MRSLDVPICLGRWMRAVILVLSCPALWLTAAAQPAPLRLVSTAWPPFTNAPRQPRFALDLVEDALGRIDLTARTTIVSAPQFTPSLLAGLFDGSGAAWKDPERERALIFSQPYLENRLVLVGRLGADVSAKTLGRSAGQTDRHRRGLLLWRGDRQRRAGVGPIAQRGRQPHAAAQGDVGLHADGRARRPLHREQLPEGIGRAAAVGSTPLVTRELYFAVNRARPDASRSSSGSTRRSAHDRRPHLSSPAARGLD